MIQTEGHLVRIFHIGNNLKNQNIANSQNRHDINCDLHRFLKTSRPIIYQKWLFDAEVVHTLPYH